MDIKAPPAKYAALAGIPDLDLRRIETSLTLLREASVPCEFRTTVVPGMLDAEDLVAIARWLSSQSMGSLGPYVLQQFRGRCTLDPDLVSAVPYARDVLLQAADEARAWLPDVICRGI